MLESLNRKYNQFILSYCNFWWAASRCTELFLGSIKRSYVRGVRYGIQAMRESYEDGQETGMRILQELRTKKFSRM